MTKSRALCAGFVVMLLISGFTSFIFAGYHHPKLLYVSIQQLDDCKLKIKCRASDLDGDLSHCEAPLYKSSEPDCFPRKHVKTFKIDFPAGSGKEPVTATSEVFRCECNKYYIVYNAVAVDTRGWRSSTKKSSCVKCMKEVVLAAPSLTQIGLIVLAVLLASSLAFMIRRMVITRPTRA